MFEYDLHMHTTNSDGRDSPITLIQKASDNGLKGIVITDHSGITYKQELIAEAELYHSKLLFPGVEISTKYEGNKYHVLAYGLGILNPEFKEFAFRPTAIKNDLYATIIESLRLDGYMLPSVEEMLRGVSNDGTYRHPGKWMLSKTLICSYLGEIADLSYDETKEIFAEKHDALKAQVPDRYLDTVETIKTIREYGALAVLAHPWWECYSGMNTPKRVAKQISHFATVGLFGIENTSRHHTEELSKSYAAFADNIGLLTFSGSDYHGDGKSELGQYGVTHQHLQYIIETAHKHGYQLLD